MATASKTSSIFVHFVENSWDVVTQVPPHNAAYVIVKILTDNYANEPKKLRLVQKWWIANSATINEWLREVHYATMTEEEFFDDLQKNLLVQ